MRQYLPFSRPNNSLNSGIEWSCFNGILLARSLENNITWLNESSHTIKVKSVQYQRGKGKEKKEEIEGEEKRVKKG